MRIKQLSLDRFGPFKRYSIMLDAPDRSLLLLTGRNNEGKSNIILALKLLAAATRVIGSERQRIVVDGDPYYRLLRQDVGELNIGRLIHNYVDPKATIHADLGSCSITVHVDQAEDAIYAERLGRLPPDLSGLLGFVPPLGPLAETEDRLSLQHVRNSIDTSLAPRHLRNHFEQILSAEQFELVQRLVKDSWPEVELLSCEYDSQSNRLSNFYREDRYEREISWAGQGLQVWFQVLTHMVRLGDRAVLVLDEPEINLHPEKQNDLVRILRERHDGSVLIATHSVELMNNVDVSHIVHVQRGRAAPVMKTTTDRGAIDLIRSQVGSNFNLVASQFEDVDLVLFTEDRSDHLILKSLAEQLDLTPAVFPVPLHGFSEYRKALFYKEAYEALIGPDKAAFCAVLDRDYYPSDYLSRVAADLEGAGIRCEFTPGKEMENLFLQPELVESVLDSAHHAAWSDDWSDFLTEDYPEALGSANKLYREFSKVHKDYKDVTKAVLHDIGSGWGDSDRVHTLVHGKRGLKRLRRFYQDTHGSSLTERRLLEHLSAALPPAVDEFVRAVYSVA